MYTCSRHVFGTDIRYSVRVSYRGHPALIKGLGSTCSTLYVCTVMCDHVPPGGPASGARAEQTVGGLRTETAGPQCTAGGASTAQSHGTVLGDREAG